MDKNKQVDPRHDLDCSVIGPEKEEEEIRIHWCETCRLLITVPMLERYGHCPRCKGSRLRGGYPTLWDRAKLFWWMLTENWRVTGKWKRDVSIPSQ